VKGRKRHILVDTLGLLLMVVVTAANVQDRDGAKQLLEMLRHRYMRLRHIWADGAYTGPLGQWVKELRPQRPIRLEITKRSDIAKGFVVIPKRWIVERTFGWFNRYRRLSKDYELLPETSEAVIQVTMIHLMIRRLARIAPY
jgi:putative transposase